MRLKPQNSAKQVLEAEIEESRQARGLLTEDINALVKQRNQMKLEVEAEGERLMASLRDTEAKCAVRKRELLSEISSLESRRAAAMEPLDEKRRHLDERKKELDSAYALLAVDAQKLSEEREKVSEKVAEVANLMAEAKEKDARAEQKLARVKDAELFHEKSMSALNERWEQFHLSVQEQEKSMVKRLEDISLRENAMEAERKWQVEERNRIASEKRAMQSERTALDAAFAEGRKKKYL